MGLEQGTKSSNKTKQRREKTRLQHQGEYGYPVRELEVQFGLVEREEWGGSELGWQARQKLGSYELQS